MMTGIIVAGHGAFSSGLKSSIDLIAGEQENVKYIDFVEEDSVETLEEKLRKTINLLGETESILFLTDLVGGSPFKTSAVISSEYENSAVVGGVNVPMLLELLFIRKHFNARELMDKSVEYGINGIKTYYNK